MWKETPSDTIHAFDYYSLPVGLDKLAVEQHLQDGLYQLSFAVSIDIST